MLCPALTTRSRALSAVRENVTTSSTPDSQEIVMNTTFKRLAATGLVSSVVAVPALVALAPAAHADIEKQGSCGNGVYELSVDRENGGFEVNFDLDGVASGSQWRVVLKHDGKRYFKKVRTADREGEIDVEKWRSNTAGKDVFRAKATNTSTGATCTAKITVS